MSRRVERRREESICFQLASKLICFSRHTALINQCNNLVPVTHTRAHRHTHGPIAPSLYAPHPLRSAQLQTVSDMILY